LRDRLGELARQRRSREAVGDGVLGPGALPVGAALAVDAVPAAGTAIIADAPPSPAAQSRARRARRAALLSPLAPPAVGVEAYLPGGEWRDERGAVYVHERLRSDVEARRADWGRMETPPANEDILIALAKRGLERALFLDLETGGLASSPVFLAGTMHWNGEDFVLRQYFARHYGEEAALLRALAVATRGFDYLVTFNGKSYDAPFLANRAIVHGVALALPPHHVDLLHIARRRWKRVLRDCRLQTLEFHVCRRRRSGDVPGEEVPGLYHDYVRSGDPWRLVPVFHHNLLDVITMAEILRALCTPPRDPDEDQRTTFDD